jgi:hypothetical protein
MSDSEEDNIAFGKNQHGTAEQSIEAGTEYGYECRFSDKVFTHFSALMEKPWTSTHLLAIQIETQLLAVESVATRAT